MLLQDSSSFSHYTQHIRTRLLRLRPRIPLLQHRRQLILLPTLPDTLLPRLPPQLPQAHSAAPRIQPDRRRRSSRKELIPVTRLLIKRPDVLLRQPSHLHQTLRNALGDLLPRELAAVLAKEVRVRAQPRRILALLNHVQQHDVRARQVLDVDLRLDAQAVADVARPAAHEGEARDRRQLDGQAPVALVPPVDLGRDDDGDFRLSRR